MRLSVFVAFARRFSQHPLSRQSTNRRSASLPISFCRLLRDMPYSNGRYELSTTKSLICSIFNLQGKRTKHS